MPSNNRKRKKSISQRNGEDVKLNIDEKIDNIPKSPPKTPFIGKFKPIKDDIKKPVDNLDVSKCMDNCKSNGESPHPSEDINGFCEWVINDGYSCISKCNLGEIDTYIIEYVNSSCKKCLFTNDCTIENVYPQDDTTTDDPSEIELPYTPDIEIHSKLLSDGRLIINIDNNILFPITGLQFKISNIDFGLTDETIHNISDLNESDAEVNIRGFVVKRGKEGFLIMMNPSLNSTTNKNITISFDQYQYNVLEYKSDICIDSIIIVDNDGDKFSGNVIGNCNDSSVKDIRV
jgi:hypothetical protein